MTGSQVVRCLCFVSLLLGVSSESWAADYLYFHHDSSSGRRFRLPPRDQRRGQIVGSFNDATGNHGFLKDGATFTTIDIPGAAFTAR